MFKVNNENIRTTSMTYFIPFSGVFIVEFEKVNVSWELETIPMIIKLPKYSNYTIWNIP